MTSPENENPYQSPNVKEAATSDASGAQHLTTLEKVSVAVLAIAVAVPVFFTTCIGGGFTLFAVGAAQLHGGSSDLMFFILWAASFLIAAWAGFVVARWFYRKKAGRFTSGEKRSSTSSGDDQ